MLFEILTLFPRMLEVPLSESLLGKARQAGLIDVEIRDIRAYARGKHKVCDDSPYGGGPGMVMKPEPLVECIEAARSESGGDAFVVLLSPRGTRFDQSVAASFAKRQHVILVCGRYEGVDERVLEHVDAQLSVGDFVLSGGEPAAWVVVDAVSRLLPGVLGNEASAEADSFSDGLLEHPQYTRPPEFRGRAVPGVLLSGDHAAIARWRRREALLLTKRARPDLFCRMELSAEDSRLLAEVDEELAQGGKAS